MATRSTARRAFLITAAATAAAVTLAGCGGGASEADGGGGATTLRLSVFGDTGNMRTLADQYEEENPGITVELNNVASAEDARTNLLTKLAAGNGLADVEQLEIGWIADLRPYASEFVPVAGDAYGDWVPVQQEPITVDGKMFGYGLGTGPLATCYRSGLLEAAGLPGDPDGASELMGTWDDYFAAGEQYVAGGGQGAWYDSSYLTFIAQVEQLEFPYEDEDGNVIVDNPEVEGIFKDTLALADTLSAKLAPFSEDWNAGFNSGAFATIGCPSWLLTTIEGNSPDITDWNVANAFPGGGGNLGGAYLAVPTQSDNPEEAAALASWLTAPEQQIAAFEAGAAFPSRLEALESTELTGITSEYFNNAPIGQIYADRSQAIPEVTYKGPNYIAIDTAAFNAMTRVEAGQQSIDDAWAQFVEESEAAAE